MAAPRIDVARRLEIESIFENAIERPTADRWDWVAEQCGTDRHLRAEVQALIAAHERTDGVLELEITGALLDALEDVAPRRRAGRGASPASGAHGAQEIHAGKGVRA